MLDNYDEKAKDNASQLSSEIDDLSRGYSSLIKNPYNPLNPIKN